MFSWFRGSKAPAIEELDECFYTTVRQDKRDFRRPGEITYTEGSLIIAKPRRSRPDSYIFATKYAGDAIDAGGWAPDAKLVLLKSKKVGTHPDNERLVLLERAFVAKYLPSSRALGENGAMVMRFLDELWERGRVNAPNRIPSSAWNNCMEYLKQEQHDANKNELGRAAWNAAYALALELHCSAACDAASDFAKDYAMRASHLSDVADLRDAATPGTKEYEELSTTIRVRLAYLNELKSPLYKREAQNVGAGLAAERAALGLVMQRHLDENFFDALTKPFRRFVDKSMLGCL